MLRADGEPAAPGEPGEICHRRPGSGARLPRRGRARTAERVRRARAGPLASRRAVSTAPATGRAGATTAAIEFLGRRDKQVKLRGPPDRARRRSRRAIARCPQVRAAAVALHGDTTDTRRLVAYVVAAEAVRRRRRPTSGATLRASLPEYMLPASIVWLPTLPLNASGKLDRRALPPPADAVAPRQRGARAAARHVRAGARRGSGSACSACATSGVFDHFFEQGGHSLLAARLVDEIERETGLAAAAAGAVRRRHDRGARQGAARRARRTSRRRSCAIHGDGTRCRRSCSCTATSPAAASTAARSRTRSVPSSRC